MNPGPTEEQQSSKIHGDKLEHESQENKLVISPHDKPQTDGGTKLHGDKLDPPRDK